MVQQPTKPVASTAQNVKTNRHYSLLTCPKCTNAGGMISNRVGRKQGQKVKLASSVVMVGALVAGQVHSLGMVKKNDKTTINILQINSNNKTKRVGE